MLLLVNSFAEIMTNYYLDSAGDRGPVNRRAQALAKLQFFIGASSEGDLKPLLALLIDAQNSNMTNMMVTTSIHTTRDLDLNIPQGLQLIRICK